MNSFLEEWDYSNKKATDENAKVRDQYIYTVFAGGDDLMLISPSSAALKLIESLNSHFKDFVCGNDEIHISYSMTNFKDHTPIRLVSDFSENNQEIVKQKLKNRNLYKSLDAMLDQTDSFNSSKDKAGLYIFNTVVKSNNIASIIEAKESLIKWIDDKSNPVNNSIVFNMLALAELMIMYHEKNDTSKLLWHPYLTRMINRLLKDRNGKYIVPETEQFFEKALDIVNYKKNKSDFHRFLYPLICSTILEIRNN